MNADGRSDNNAGQILKAVVSEVKTSGALVVLSDGTKGWFPGQEVLPDLRPHEDFRQRTPFEAGAQVELVAFDSEIGGSRVLVSMVRVANDAWNEVAGWYDGDLKTMEVTSQVGNRAIGLIGAGRVGRTSSRLAPVAPSRQDRPVLLAGYLVVAGDSGADCVYGPDRERLRVCSPQRDFSDRLPVGGLRSCDLPNS